MFFNKKKMVAQACHKYHDLLIKGLVANGARVYCLSSLPINRGIKSELFIKEPDEQEGNAHYHYYKTINLPGFRQLMVFFGAFFSVLKIKKTNETKAICDCLNIANSYGIIMGCKIKKIPVVTIVTDIPDMQDNSKIVSAINNKLFELVDGFLFLTEQMNEKINKNNKPYLVMEGHVDEQLALLERSKSYENTLGKKIVIYAGSLKKIYGISNLVKGFMQAQIEDAELRIFGDGDYKDELIRIVEKSNNIKYMGICSNEEVVEQEQKSALLVNPRPIAPEYTKYSFPSKNMEYMVSGTPVLTTKLPGMPMDYYSYVYFIEDETPDGISKTLQNVLRKPEVERYNKGKEAREFVLKYKTNTAQADKLICFLKQEIR